MNDDGCSKTCKVEKCGDTIKQVNGPDGKLATIADNEECDDGNAVNDDGCTKTCKTEKCGDNVKQLNGLDGKLGPIVFQLPPF